MDFVNREFMLMLLYLAAVRLQDVCLYGYECLTDPHLYNADHCCLSLSRALACCTVFYLALWVASYLKNSYCVLRADIYLHYFVA